MCMNFNQIHGRNWLKFCPIVSNKCFLLEFSANLRLKTITKWIFKEKRQSLNYSEKC